MKFYQIIVIVFLLSVVCVTSNYSRTDEYCEALFPISNKQKRWGYIDCKGNIIVSPQFDYAYNFNDGVGTVQKETNKAGFVDLKGNITLFENFLFFSTKFSEGLALANYNSKVGFVDKTGKFVIEFDNAVQTTGFSEGIAAIQDVDNKYYFVNKKGVKVIEQGFDDVQLGFKDGMATVFDNQKYAVINNNGEYIIKPQTEYISYPSDGLVGSHYENQKVWKFFDNTGELILTSHFELVNDFTEGLAGFRQNEKWGFIDKSGKILIKAQYDNIEQFSEGLAAVSINDKMGFIDKQGRQIIPLIYDSHPINIKFNNGLVKIEEVNRELYLNKKGKIVWLRTLKP